MKRTTEKLISSFLVCSALVLWTILIYASVNRNNAIALIVCIGYMVLVTIYFCMNFIKLQNKIVEEEPKRALEIIQQHLNEEFSVVHPTDKDLRIYETYGIQFKAKLSKEFNVIIVRTVSPLEKVTKYQDRKCTYVTFIRMFIDDEYK